MPTGAVKVALVPRAAAEPAMAPVAARTRLTTRKRGGCASTATTILVVADDSIGSESGLSIVCNSAEILKWSPGHSRTQP